MKGEGFCMFSVGIDASKGKSTVCIINQYGEVLLSPKDYKHNKEDLALLSKTIRKLTGNEDVKIVMEATGIYHWPVLFFLKNDYFLSVINPLKMKLFSKDYNFRGVKTDKIDSKIIAMYGIEKWYSLKQFVIDEDIRQELKRLSRSYMSYQKPKIVMEQALDLEIEKMMPGIKKILTDDEKLFDFIEYFHHYNNISKLSKEKFIDKFNKWKKKKGHRFYSYTPDKIYQLATSVIPTSPCDETSKLTIVTITNSIRVINQGLDNILSRMHELASKLPEYEVVLAMKGVGYILAPLLISEIGDIRMYNSKKSLVCTAGIDVPPYESGQFKANRRTITKKGNKYLRRHLYLVMTSLIMSKSKNDSAVYDFMMKKKTEHKLDKQVKVAGMRKFLHIYYARVKEQYQQLGIWDIKE